MKAAITLILISLFTLGPYGCASQSQVNILTNQLNLVQHRTAVLEKENKQLKEQQVKLTKQNKKQQKQIQVNGTINVFQHALIGHLVKGLNKIMKEFNRHERKFHL